MRPVLVPAVLLALALGGCADSDAPDAEAPARPVSTAAPTAEAAQRGALGVGDRAPDFVLPDIDGGEVRLSDVLQGGPVVLAFYRGAWCPYCNTSLRGFQAELGRVMDAGGYLIAVSPQAQPGSEETVSQGALSFPVLSDVGNRVARAYGLVFQVDEETKARYQAVGIDLPAIGGADAWELPVPATYVIGTDGVIRSAFVEADYTQRANPRDVIQALRDIG